MPIVRNPIRYLDRFGRPIRSPPEERRPAPLKPTPVDQSVPPSLDVIDKGLRQKLQLPKRENPNRPERQATQPKARRIPTAPAPSSPQPQKKPQPKQEIKKPEAPKPQPKTEQQPQELETVKAERRGIDLNSPKYRAGYSYTDERGRLVIVTQEQIWREQILTGKKRLEDTPRWFQKKYSNLPEVRAKIEKFKRENPDAKDVKIKVVPGTRESPEPRYILTYTKETKKQPVPKPTPKPEPNMEESRQNEVRYMDRFGRPFSSEKEKKEQTIKPENIMSFPEIDYGTVKYKPNEFFRTANYTIIKRAIKEPAKTKLKHEDLISDSFGRFFEKAETTFDETFGSEKTPIINYSIDDSIIKNIKTFPEIREGSRTTKSLLREEGVIKKKSEIQNRVALKTDKTVRDTIAVIAPEGNQFIRSALTASPFGIAAGAYHFVTDKDAISFVIEHPEETYKDTMASLVGWPLFVTRDIAEKAREGNMWGAAGTAAGTAFSLATIDFAVKGAGKGISKTIRKLKNQQKADFAYSHSGAILDKENLIVHKQTIKVSPEGEIINIGDTFTTKTFKPRFKKIPLNDKGATKLIDLPPEIRNEGVLVTAAESRFFTWNEPAPDVVKKVGTDVRIEFFNEPKAKKMRIEKDFDIGHTYGTKVLEVKKFPPGGLDKIRTSLSMRLEPEIPVSTPEFIKFQKSKLNEIRMKLAEKIKPKEKFEKYGEIIEENIIDKDVEQLFSSGGGGTRFRIKPDTEFLGAGSSLGESLGLKMQFPKLKLQYPKIGIEHPGLRKLKQEKTEDMTGVEYEFIPAPPILGSQSTYQNVHKIWTLNVRQMKKIPSHMPMQKTNLIHNLGKLEKVRNKSKSEPMLKSNISLKESIGIKTRVDTRTNIDIRKAAGIKSDLARTQNTNLFNELGLKQNIALRQRLEPEIIRKYKTTRIRTARKNASEGLVRMPAFDVFVRRKGKWIKETEFPLPKFEAMNLGAKEVLSTAAASFKLVPKGFTFGKIGEFSFANMFRRPKGKSKLGQNVFVEKEIFRIDTPGELKEITAKGIVASKKKRKTKTKKSKKKSKRKSPLEELFGELF